MTRPAADKALRRKFYNRCNPDEPLGPDDDRNVDVDGESAKARGANLVDELARSIELSDLPVCEFFTGLPGSGKSTELRRLASRLAAEDGAHLFPVVIDAEEVLDLYNPIDVPDILAAILQKTEELLLIAEGKSPKDALQEGRLSRFWRWLTRTTVEVKEIEFGPEAKVDVPEAAEFGAGAKVVLDLKANPSIREKVRKRIAANMTTFSQEVKEAVKELEGRARALGFAGLIVIFDSLEKLRGISTNWTEVLSSAERVFNGGAPYLQIPVHVIYTFPPALALRLKVSDLRYLPMLKLFDREHRICDEGFEAAREIVRRRVPDAFLNELFGPTSREERVKELIIWSGGYPREIIRILRQFVAEPRVDAERFDHMLAQAGDSYRRTVPESDYELLARVHVEKTLPIATEDHRETIDRMLSNNVVLRYQNRKEWFDIHPAMHDVLKVQEAIERLRAAGVGPSSRPKGSG